MDMANARAGAGYAPQVARSPQIPRQSLRLCDPISRMQYYTRESYGGSVR